VFRDVAVLERDPLAGAQPGRGGEDDERSVTRSDFGGDPFDFAQIRTVAFLCAGAPVVDALLGWVQVDQPPADGSC
jgi:hypothetical protein